MINCWSRQALAIRDVQRRVRVELLETVGEGEVPVQPRFKPFDIIDEQAGFECVAGPG